MFSPLILLVSLVFSSHVLAQQPAYEVDTLSTSVEQRTPWLMSEYELTKVYSGRLKRDIALLKRSRGKFRVDHLFDVIDGQFVDVKQIDVHMVEPALESLVKDYGVPHTIHYTTFNKNPYALVGLSHQPRPSGQADVMAGVKFGGASLEGIAYSAFVMIGLSGEASILKVYEVDERSANFNLQQIIHEYAYFELSRRFHQLCYLF